MQAAFEEGLQLHTLTWSQTEQIKILYEMFLNYKRRIENCDRFLIALIEGRINLKKRNEEIANFFIDVLGGFYVERSYITTFWLYLRIVFGDINRPRSLPAMLGYKYFPERQREHFFRMCKKQREDAFAQSNKDPDIIRAIHAGLKPKSIEQCLKEDMEDYDTRGVIIHDHRPAIPGRKRTYILDATSEEGRPIYLPDFPPVVFNLLHEITLIGLCKDELKKSMNEGKTSEVLFELVDELKEFCELLAK